MFQSDHALNIHFIESMITALRILYRILAISDSMYQEEFYVKHRVLLDARVDRNLM